MIVNSFVFKGFQCNGLKILSSLEKKTHKSINGQWLSTDKCFLIDWIKSLLFSLNGNNIFLRVWDSHRSGEEDRNHFSHGLPGAVQHRQLVDHGLRGCPAVRSDDISVRVAQPGWIQYEGLSADVLTLLKINLIRITRTIKVNKWDIFTNCKSFEISTYYPSTHTLRPHLTEWHNAIAVLPVTRPQVLPVPDVLAGVGPPLPGPRPDGLSQGIHGQVTGTFTNIPFFVIQLRTCKYYHLNWKHLHLTDPPTPIPPFY